jgi:hypothetical protein
MTDKPRTGEFGKRRPAPTPAAPPPKRSSHVALLVMGTLAVGGGAYALMPRESCQPAPSLGMAAPAMPTTGTACTTRTSTGGSGSGGTSRSSGYSFFGGDSSGGSSSTSVSSSSSVTRGGFGSFAHAFGFGGG